MAKQNLFIAGELWEDVEQLEIPLSNDDGTAATETKAKFIETTVEENAATAEDILLNKKAWVNGVEIAGGIPSLAATNYELKYTDTDGIDEQPTQTILSGSYLAENVTVTAPTYNDLTTPGNAACPVTSASPDEYIVNGLQYIKNGTLHQGIMEALNDKNLDDADIGYKNTILELGPADSSSYPGIFSLLRVSSGEGGNNGKAGSFYIQSNPGVQNYEIDQIFIRNLTPDVVLAGTEIGGIENAPIFTGSLPVPAIKWKNNDSTSGILLIS